MMTGQSPARLRITIGICQEHYCAKLHCLCESSERFSSLLNAVTELKRLSENQRIMRLTRVQQCFFGSNRSIRIKVNPSKLPFGILFACKQDIDGGRIDAGRYRQIGWVGSYGSRSDK
jgi:hypothetical protein